MKLSESTIDTSKKWYFGNNRTKNLKLSKPSWYAPFFLTTNYSYAEKYSDYGVYCIELASESKSKVLDFNSKNEVSKLKWPKVLIDKIKDGHNDLNSLAYDMYILAYNTGGKLMYIDDSPEWKKASAYFKVKSNGIFKQIQHGASTWGDEKDHEFVLQMWKDIYDAGFDGFIQNEFNNQVLAIFNFKFIDKISIYPVSKTFDEDRITNNEVHLSNTTKSPENKSLFLEFAPNDVTPIMEDKSLNENKAAYLRKYAEEDDVDTIVEMFWHIRNRLSSPQNDIDWWIKKPFIDLKRFVQNFDPSNKRQRRDADYREDAIDNDAKLLDIKDGYEIWYVPTYEAMRILGRFYKGRSAKWCVASDDPEFWFDNHDEDEFIVLIRENPQNDEFDKVAIQMEHHGRYYKKNDFVPWDLQNNDWTFTNDNLIKYAWLLFKDNGELRQEYN